MFRSIFENPIITAISAIASIISIPLAIYFYLDGKTDRNLTYYVHPVKAAIVKAGESSRLSVRFGNKELKSDITAAQIAFWNKGQQSIRKENILKPIIIQTDSSVPILEAILRKTSRDVSNISLDRSNIATGILRIDWDILEKNDGGVIQLIYAGSPQVSISASGVVEGQLAINKIEFTRNLQSETDQYIAQTRGMKVLGYFFAILAVLYICKTLFDAIKVKKRGEAVNINYYEEIKGLLFLIVLSVLSFYLGLDFGPPFGF